MLNELIHYFLATKLVTALLLLLLVGRGLVTAPSGRDLGALPSDPVAVDAITDIGFFKDIEHTALATTFVHAVAAGPILCSRAKNPNTTSRV
ncbi:MAG: hypothetical protein KF843_02120 [Flavobacteriales bacterium]|nr:hypothetical protein [Flavobacteriales bacterium]